MSDSAIDALKATQAELYQWTKALLDRAANEKRGLTAAEELSYRGFVDQINELAQQIEDMESQRSANQSIMAKIAEIRSKPVATDHVGKPTAADQQLAEEFRDRIRRQSREPVEVPMTGLRSGFSPGLERRNSPEARALTTTTGSGLVPSSFYGQVVQHLTEANAILAAGATIVTTETGEPMSVPASSATSSAQIVAEAGTIPTSDPSLGTVPLPVYKFGFMTSVTHELAADASFDLLGYLARQAAESLANAFSEYFINGSGTGEPKGLLASVTTGKTGEAVTPTFDDLVDLLHSVASPYARADRAAWIMGNSMLAEVRKLKDANDRPLLEVDVPRGTGAAGMLLGRPIFIDASMPDPEEGEKTILFGDFSRYFVRFAGGMRFERSDDYSFANDLITFRALSRVGGALTDTTGAIKAFVSGPAAE